jgi:biopolymer transport protein TolR
MGMSAGSGRSGVKSEINVTPLVDVVLVLLIIFMVVTPMMQRGQAVQLPKSAHSSEEKSDPLVLSVTADQKLYVENDLYPDVERFKGRLEQELRTQPLRRVLLKADHTLACGDVQKVMDLIHTAGAKRVGLGVEAPKSP